MNTNKKLTATFFSLKSSLLGNLLFLFFTYPLFSQNFNFIQYGLRDGLPHSQINDLIQDDSGFLWIATNGGGLARFNGDQFQVFSKSDGLSSNFINALTAQDNGNLWLGTDKGVSIIEGNNIQKIADLTETDVTDIAFLNDSILAIGSTRGLDFYNILQQKKLPSKITDASVNDILKLDNGQLSVATNRGWWLIRSIRDIENVTTEDGLLSQKIITTVQKSRNSIWVITASDGMTLHRINYPNQIIKSENLPAKNITSALLSSKNTLWFGTKNAGIYIAKNLVYTNINRRNGLPNNSIKKIIQDNLGQHWLASTGGGLIKILEQDFKFFNQSDGLPANSVNTIAQDSSTNQIWLGLAENGLVFIEEDQIYPYRLDKDFLNVPVTALCFDQQNRLLAGTAGKGIGLFDSLGLYQILDANRGLSSDNITSLATDNNGDIWVGTKNNGLSLINLSIVDSLEKITLSPIVSTAGQQINTIKKDLDGNIWFANNEGKLGKVISEKNIVYYDSRNGLPGSSINAMKFDQKGGLWLGTAGEGLVYSEKVRSNPKFQRHPVNPKLSSANIYLIDIDNQGDLWIGNIKGVEHFSPASENLSVTYYGYAQGFIGGETNLNASQIDSEGNIWFGTVGGLMRIQGGIKATKSTAPILSFKVIKIQNQSIEASPYQAFNQNARGIKKGLILPWNIDQIEFQFQGVHLNYPKNIKYSWRLKGQDEEWSSWSKSNIARFNTLPSGKYQFEARATYNEEEFSNIVESNFVISSPVWRKGWFKWALGILSILLITAVAYWRVQQIRKKEKLKRKNLEMQNELLNLNQKALQLQMNPHFIFNTLNSINALVAKNENAEARKQINNFAKQLRSTLSNSRKEYISLEEEVKSLKEYLVMLQFCHSTPFDFQIIVSKNINVEEIELPPMIIQPFVENAVLHGLNQINRPGLVTVNFGLQGKLIVCTIEDNGIGRKAAGISKAQKNKSHQSAGMEVTKSRLDNLKNKLNYKSLEIIDLANDGTATGTKVIVRIPYRVSY